MRLLSVSELGRVPGMTAGVVERVEPMVTVYSGRPYVDPGSAPRGVLLALPGVQPAAADRFLAARADQDTGRGPLPLDLLGPARRYLRQSRSNVFRVSAQAELPGGIVVRRRAVLRIIPGRSPPYQVFAWFPDEEAASPAPAEGITGGIRP